MTQKTSKFSSLLLTFLLWGLLSHPVAADDFVWTGGAANNVWNDANNWVNVTAGGGTDLDGIPDANDTAEFLNSATTTNGSAMSLAIASSTTFSIDPGFVTISGGTITNNGTLSYTGNIVTSLDEVLTISGDVLLAGGGVIELIEQNDSRISGANSSSMLTNLDNTIRGTGNISVDLNNESLLLAELGTLFVSDVVNVLGDIQIASDGTLHPINGDIVGGTVTGAVGSRILGTNGSFRDLTMSGEIAVGVGTATIGGNIDNTGTLTYEGNIVTTSNESLLVDGAASLAGGGEVILVEQNDSVISETVTSSVLTNVNNTIRGTGTVSVDVVNEGLMRAEFGTLTVGNINNSNGNIQIANDGVLRPLNGDVVGGSVSGDVGSRIQSQNGSLRDLTMTGNVAVAVGIAEVGGNITNNGTLTFEGNLATTGNETLLIDGATTFGGNGEIVLIEQDDSFISETTSSSTLTNASNTIRGTGSISVDMINQGLMRAESGTLTVGNVDNTLGNIEIASDAVLRPANGDISGGTILGLAGSRLLSFNGSFRDLTLNGTNSVAVGNAAIGGTIVNNGTLTFETNAVTTSNEILIVNGATRLEGGGELVLVEQDDSLISEFGSTDELTNVDNTIRGTGSIIVDVVNEGLMRAESGTLTVGNIDNSLGNIEVAADGVLRPFNGVISGGTISGVVNSRISSFNGSFRDLTFSGVNSVAVGNTTIGGTINNPGTLTFESNIVTTSNEILIVDGPTRLEGGGEVILAEQDDSLISEFTSTDLLTNVDNTIRGTGSIIVDVANEGLLRAESGTLTVGNVDNSIGNIEIAADGVLRPSFGEVSGGIVDGAVGSRISSFNGSFRDLSLTGTHSVAVGSATISGNIVNYGTLTFEANTVTTSNETLIINGATRLDGGGEVVLVEQNDSQIAPVGSMDVLTNADNTIRGTGNIFVDIVNDGIMRPEFGAMFTANIDNTNGEIQVAADGLLQPVNGFVSNGLISGEPGSRLLSINGGFSDVVLNGELAVGVGQTTFTNGLTNTGRLTFQGNTASTSNETLRIDGVVPLDGGGEVVLLEQNDSEIVDATGTSLLMNVDNTISGIGNISIDLVNSGTLFANSDAGVFQFFNDLTLMPEGEVAVLLDGPNFNDSGFFNIIPPVDLAGTLKLVAGDNFSAAIGTSYIFLMADDLLGSEFDEVDQTETKEFFFDVSYGIDFVEVIFAAFKVQPDTFAFTRGEYVSGGLPELAVSDNVDLVGRRNTADIQSRVTLEVKSLSPVPAPNSFEFTVESAVFARSQVTQSVDLFNYNTGSYEQVDTRSANRFGDSVVTIAATGDLSRFVEPGTNCIEARIRYRSVSPRQRFSANIDNVFWKIN